MKRSELFFELPQAFIAQEPVEPRDHCKLMVLDRQDQSIRHDRFFRLADYLREDDVLVFNQSKVLPARLIGAKGEAKREVLLLKEVASGAWQVLIKGRVEIGDIVAFPGGLEAEIIEKQETTFLVRFNKTGSEFFQTIQKIGLVPTPPYMKQFTGDPNLYQTVYAQTSGSAAAPTAGLHFTQQLLDALKEQGVQQEFVTLHVGLGTFQPIKTEIVEDHPIHSEYFEVDAGTIERLRTAKKEGRRIIAVGTTSVRVLETVFANSAWAYGDTSRQGETAIFIYPGYKFQAVDALITNFHTPYSSLLALVFAFAGKEFILQAYEEAKKQDYRFFSFGDAMLIC